MPGSLSTSTLAALIAAPIVGSFLATVVVRYPDWRSIIWGRSNCPTCRTSLSARDLVPILSWCMAVGRCRHCRVRISVFYPVMEILALLIALWSATVFAGWQLWAVCALGWVLLVLSAIDIRHFLLPDALTMPLLLGGLVSAAVKGSPYFQSALIGATAGFAIFAAIGCAYYSYRNREGLGLGDAKLLAAAGAWAGWAGLPDIVLIACLSAIAVITVAKGKEGLRMAAATPIAFGPFICAATWLSVLYGPHLLFEAM